MYLMGTIGSMITIHFLYEYVTGQRDQIREAILTFASMIPDLIDKPIGGFLVHKGRWIGHSLVIQTAVFLLIMGFYSLSNESIEQKIKRKWIIYLYIGSVFHLITDIASLHLNTVFWPFLGPFPNGSTYGFLNGALTTKNLVIELIGVCLIVIVGWKENWKQKTWGKFATLLLLYIIAVLVMYSLFVTK